MPPDEYLEHVKRAKAATNIPIIGSLNGVSSGGWIKYARLIEQGGADALELNVYWLVLFNRFNQPDFDLEILGVVERPLISRAGDGEALRLPLRWIAILFGRVAAGLAATGGVHQAEDALKLLMAGANVTMLASALLLHGPDRLRTILQDMSTWLEQNEYLSALSYAAA